MSRSSPVSETGASAVSPRPRGSRRLMLQSFRLQFRPPDEAGADGGAVPARGEARAARRAGRPSRAVAPTAAARRTDAVASAFSSLIRKGRRRAVGAESRRSPHPVVRLAPYAMSRDGCRPLPRAAADSNRPSLGPSSTQSGSKVPRYAALRAAAALVHAPRRLSAPTAVSRRASSPSWPPAARRRGRGGRGRARRPCGGAGRRRPSPSA